jgi:hypothetical protein
VKQVLSFALLASALILGGAWGITILRPEPEIARAVWTSAFIALGTQGLTFGIARQFSGTQPIVGWGIGSLIRFAVVMLFAFVGAGALGVETMPGLLSLVGFLFVTMIVEPLFLKPS